MKLGTTKKVKKSGSALCVFLTKELHDMGISEGDLVKITIEKIEH